MVMTNTLKKEQKAKPIYVKENNSDRQFMSHADAVKDNARLKAEREAIEDYKAELKAKRGIGVSVPDNVIVDKDESKIAKLEAQLEAERGPGSHIRKQKLQAQIDDLKGDSKGEN